MTSLLRLALLIVMSSAYLYLVFGSHAALFNAQDVLLMLNGLVFFQQVSIRREKRLLNAFNKFLYLHLAIYHSITIK